MALVWHRHTGPRLRGTMGAFFLVGSVMSLVTLAAVGAITIHTLTVFAVLIPAALLGYGLSRGLNRILDPNRLRWLAIGASALGSVVLISRELLTLGG